jgi:hypothetical protein
MLTTRGLEWLTRSKPTIDGAGVRVNRVFARIDYRLDPFLLLDDFGSSDPADYEKGFPFHPHRGIETITYLLEGKMAVRDSLGNESLIEPGGLQWLTAGSGVVHEEMPLVESAFRGFQLWSNLPAAHKMRPPRCQDITGDQIPECRLGEGVIAKVICGKIGPTMGPVRPSVTNPEFLDVRMKPSSHLEYAMPEAYNVFAYVVSGAVHPTGDSNPRLIATNSHLLVLSDGNTVRFTAGDEGARILLVSGRPIREPVAWDSTIVMNTRQELECARREYETGNFTKQQELRVRSLEAGIRLPSG